MLTKRMFWATVAVATAAASIFAWLMIKATDEHHPVLAAPQPPTTTFASPAQPPPPATSGKISKSVGLNLKAAIDAIKRKEFANARSYLSWAEDATDKTPFDKYKISEVWAYFYGAQKNYPGLLIAYQDMIAHSNHPQFPQHERSTRPTDKTIGQLAATLGDYPQAITASERWLADHPNDQEAISLLTHSYYSTKNYRSCLNSATRGIQIAERANSRPSEALLQFMRSCADTLGDQSGALWALEKLCQYFPKPDYWNSYIQTKSRNAKEFASYYWLRLLIEAVPKTAADDYANFAQMSALVFNLPATGARAIEQGIANGVLDMNTRQGARHAKTLEVCRSAAQAERERLVGLTNGAQPDPTGQVTFAAGRIQFDNKQLDQAIRLLTAALQKGGFKEIDNARFMLGIAQFEHDDRVAARATFDALKSDPTLEAVANAWFVRTYN